MPLFRALLRVGAGIHRTGIVKETNKTTSNFLSCRSSSTSNHIVVDTNSDTGNIGTGYFYL